MLRVFFRLYVCGVLVCEGLGFMAGGDFEILKLFLVWCLAECGFGSGDGDLMMQCGREGS